MNTKSSIETKVCVIGAGNGGLAAAADLTLRGNEVTLFELSEYEQNIKGIKNSGGINLETLKSTGLSGGFARLHKVTTDISQALSESEIVLIITPAFAHKRIAKECAGFLTKEQSVVLAPGNMGGSIEFYNCLIEHGGDKDIVVSEMECMMYACRKKDSDTVYVRGYKQNLGFSTFPSIRLKNEYKRVKKIYPGIIQRNNIIETGMSNINAVLHVPIIISNLSLIDRKKDILMYHEALTNSVGIISSAMDQERCSLNKTNKEINLESLKNIYRSWYLHQGAKGSSFVELAGGNPIYYESKLPKALNHRYLLEDIPYGLIPMMSFLKRFGASYKNIESVINLACTISGVDFYNQSRNLKTLKLEEKGGEEIINYITYRR